MYKQKWHVLITLLVVMLPFLFVLIMGQISSDDKFLFLDDLLLSTFRLAIAYGISVVLALVLGVTLSSGKRGNFFLPLFDVLQSFPTFAILPMVVHFWGATGKTVVLFLIITVIWPILFAIISSLKLVHASWEEAATIYGAVGFKRLINLTVPITFPAVITGSIVGLGNGWEALVGAEIVVGLQSGGLGMYFNNHQNAPGLVFFGITAFLLFIFVINKFVFLPLLDKSHKLFTE